MKTRLKVILAEKGLKQSFIAEKAEIRLSTMSLISNGKSTPTLEVALKIAKALNLKVEDIWSLDK
ncbi:helix-turn-helix transcriptional regulator [Bacillus sp. AFS017336]|uniref:helix-turn-helix transcriptional regulator n=1 Tax=Bacillus sp. AFS017336 TaxID=2033489 RepID=UPI000BF0B2F3|nr:helix-turn-helix domain-containing protein [Bacillus sp. AFS017336]PEL12647.1 transcriptional regulator [Bacillus sp. AFS017336]